MVRGAKAEIGNTRIAQNGYHYTRTESGWRLTHHLLAEEMLGRPLTDDERVQFKDSKKRSNPTKDNIVIVQKGKSSLRRRKAQIEARIAELQSELEYINKELLANKPR